MVKFILLGQGRSGSSLITEALAEHPDVRVAGEVFHADEKGRRLAFEGLNGDGPCGASEAQYYRDGADAWEFLERVVFRAPSPGGVRAAGFKMFYLHARRNPAEKRAWSYLIANDDVRVIHLIRENMLESYISLRVAFLTGEWERLKGTNTQRKEQPLLRLEPKECEVYFNQELVWRKWAGKSFSSHPFLEIKYEGDVCARFVEVMDEIHDFISVPRRRARQLLEKQAQRPPREAVTNYDELKEYFRYTLYEDFFV
jgi:LPS sulfotransferase NodH